MKDLTGEREKERKREKLFSLSLLLLCDLENAVYFL